MPRTLAILALSSILLSGCTPAAAPPQPAGARDVGIQLFQWNWNSIARECTDALGPAGIDWVLTSPPNEHIVGREWWTSYQPVSYLVESRLGTREEFATMVSACADAGVDVIADAVINHMTGQETPGTGWAGSAYEHYNYPGVYGPADFHRCSESATGDIMDYTDATEVQTCELVNLADLATETESVRATIVGYLTDLLDLGVAGFRIDAAKHMAAADVAAIVSALPEGTRILQEVIRGAGEPITPEDYAANGEVFEFAFARDLEGMIESATLNNGESFGPDFGSLPSESAIVFVDNHDTERNGETLSYQDGDDYLLANAFMLAQAYGTPVLYSGYAFEGRDAGPPQDDTGQVQDAACAEQKPRYEPGEWTCIQSWPQIVGMLAFRSAVGDAPVTDQWSDAWSYAFGRGALGFAVFNAGDETLERTFESSLAPGEYIDAISGETVTVRSDGSFDAAVPGHSALAISVGALANPAG